MKFKIQIDLLIDLLLLFAALCSLAFACITLGAAHQQQRYQADIEECQAETGHPCWLIAEPMPMPASAKGER